MRLVSSRHTAALAGVPVSPWGGNLLVDVRGTGTGGTAEVVAGMGDGLLLTCLWYVRRWTSRPCCVTGLTRDGVYVVRDGEVVGATTNFRFNDSPAAMLGRVRSRGRPAGMPAARAGRLPAPGEAPALVVDDFHLSSVSEAS